MQYSPILLEKYNGLLKKIVLLNGGLYLCFIPNVMKDVNIFDKCNVFSEIRSDFVKNS